MGVNTIIDNALKGIILEGKQIQVNYLENPLQTEKRSDPWVTYQDISEGPSFKANDAEKERVFYYDVDIMTRKPWLIDALKKEIEKRLENVGFMTLTHASTTFSDGIAHKPLSFLITQTREEYLNE